MTPAPIEGTGTTGVLDVWADPERTQTFFKGRVALYAILRAAGIGPGDEVLVPGFTCVVVPAAILYTGARPVFYDIHPRQLNGESEAAIALVSERTRAVLIQHTFGVPADPQRLARMCRERGTLLIEDCAHALGASIHGKQVGTLGDAAFASLQWSKPVTTGLGGIARAGNEAMQERLREFYVNECTDPGWSEDLFLALASFTHARLFRPWMFWSIQRLYRQLGSLGIVRGSSDRCELTTATIPQDYARRFGRRRAGQLARTLDTLPQTVEHRRRIAKIYTDELTRRGIARQEEPPGARSVPLRVPVRVRDRDRLLEEARRCRIELGDWFNAPLHPGEAPQGVFGYQPGSCPHAERAAAELVNLPTHPGVDERAARRVLDFLCGPHERLLVHASELA